MPTAHASCEEYTVREKNTCQVLNSPYLSRVQVAETSNDLLLVQITSSCFHTTYHMQLLEQGDGFISSDGNMSGRTRLQFVQAVGFGLEGSFGSIVIFFA